MTTFSISSSGDIMMHANTLGELSPAITSIALTVMAETQRANDALSKIIPTNAEGVPLDNVIPVSTVQSILSQDSPYSHNVYFLYSFAKEFTTADQSFKYWVGTEFARHILTALTGYQLVRIRYDKVFGAGTISSLMFDSYYGIHGKSWSDVMHELGRIVNSVSVPKAEEAIVARHDLTKEGIK